jgi:FdhD protein
MTRRIVPAVVHRLDGHSRRADQDLIAVEAPLEVIVTLEPDASGLETAPLSFGLLMRTPGDDEDLARGALYTEGIVRSASDIVSVEIVAADETDRADQAHVRLARTADLDQLSTRGFSSTSACGLCGRTAMLALDRGRPNSRHAPQLEASVIASLPARLRAGQAAFAETGGLHAAGLFTAAGEIWLLREDVGRHNAVDKVVGAALAAGRLPAAGALLVVSGRLAYEIVQKAAVAGVAAVVAVGAPSSLAVDAARATHLTLIGFARDGKFNVYAGWDKLS